MTEKRFSHKNWYTKRQLVDNGEPFAIVDVYVQADKICNKLNELNDENEQLYELIDFVNTLFAFETSEFCQMKWKKRLEELKSE